MRIPLFMPHSRRRSLSRGVSLQIIFCQILLSFCSALAQSALTDKALKDRIGSGDESAMLEAGSSGDHNFVPALQQQAQTKHAIAALKALAKLGDLASQQELWCASTSNGPDDTYISAFEYVGGWFGISGLEMFLHPDGNRNWMEDQKRRSEREGVSDVIQTPPQVTALRSLARLLPDSPAGRSAPGLLATPGYSDKMREWLSQHKEELAELEPTGQGVDFSKSTCRLRTKVTGSPQKTN